MQKPMPKVNTAFSKFESTDSVVFLDPRADQGSSVSASAHGKPLTDDDGSEGDTTAPAPPLTVAVSIQQGRVLVFTVLFIALIIAVDLVFEHGVVVDHFESTTKNATDRAEMLNDANSLAGYISMAFAKPIELFVTILAQIITLRMMAHAFTKPTTSWKLMYAKIALSAAIGYMIGNAFSAVNVQLREEDVHPVIMASDLFMPSELNDSAVTRTTTAVNTVSEATASNLISNTALRNAILPRVTFKDTLCDWEQTQLDNARGGEIPLPSINYGFTQRDWQSRILQEALPATTLKTVVNPTNATVNNGVNPKKLPMNASIAADLFLYMMNVAPNVFPWGAYGDFVDDEELAKRYPSTASAEKKAGFAEPTAEVTGLLPVLDQMNESEEDTREWFFKAAVAAITRQFKNATNTSRSDIGMEFSHVDVSPSISFDAITLEVSLDPTLLATAGSSPTLFTEVIQAGTPDVLSDCGPWPALCLVKKPTYQPKPDEYVLDPVQQVQAFGACTSDYGEQLMTFSYGAKPFTCNASSNASIMVLSVGKRLVADSIVQDKADNITKRSGKPALITNLRKIYTITIGRLSWRLENLAEVFGAECNTVNSTQTCWGLHMPLSTSSLSAYGLDMGTQAMNQMLVASVEALPTDLVVPTARLSVFKPHAVMLVEVTEMPFDTVLAGDILMPHNIGQVTWANQTLRGEACDADVEALLHSKLNNHIYIEHGFQTAYTAATFFLLQDAVVKDMVVLTASNKSTTLQFNGNTQDVTVWASIPWQNSRLTLVGCGVLLLILLIAFGQSLWFMPKKKDPLAEITDPQAIARVMLDEEQFPSLLLSRQVVTHKGEEPQPRDLEKFSISKLAVAHEDEEAVRASDAA